MKDKQTTYKAAVLLLVLLAVATALLLRHRHRQAANNAGGIEAAYVSAMNTLREQTRSLRAKTKSGMTGALTLLPEEMIEKPAPPPAIEAKPNPKQAAIDTIRLKGIYWSETMPLAELNGSLAKPGETVDGFTVEEIHPYLVILSDLDGTLHTNSLIDPARLMP